MYIHTYVCIWKYIKFSIVWMAWQRILHLWIAGRLYALRMYIHTYWSSTEIRYGFVVPHDKIHSKVFDKYVTKNLTDKLILRRTKNTSTTINQKQKNKNVKDTEIILTQKWTARTSIAVVEFIGRDLPILNYLQLYLHTYNSDTSKLTFILR